MKQFLSTMIPAAALSLSLAACSADEAPEAEMMGEDVAMADTDTAAVGTIVETAQANEDFSTLVAAVGAADLVETLSSDGPFTVFAPTNAAFAKVPAETMETLLSDAGKDTLTAVLTYHVVAGKLTAQDVLSAIDAGGGTAVLTTVNGAELSASLVDGGVVITDAAGNAINVTATDVDASNGVIHVIDTVAMPG